MGWLIIIAICAGAVLTLRAHGITGRTITANTRVSCPPCREAIKPDALICPHCRSDLINGPAARAMSLGFVEV